MWKYPYFYVTVIFSKVFLTDGAVWPKPQREEKGKEIYLLNPATFEFKVEVNNCPLLYRALKRYEKIIGHEAWSVGDSAYLKKMLQLYSPLYELRIHMSGACDDYPQADMDESYSLTISSESELRSKSVWGILRGLETFAQLFEFASSDYRVKRIKATNVVDFPRYAHRGFLLDTARHYFSTAFILTHLEAMAINKYNVLHWHITDAESFPYQSEKFPELSQYGAFYRHRVYNKEAIRKIVDFAADRGIRVIPEIDMPAHTRSWGKSHPEVLVGECPYPGVLDPTSNATYYLIHQLLEELRGLFPDKYVHLGGHGFNSFKCWKNNEKLEKYMRRKKLDTQKLFGRFINKVAQYLSDRSPVYWEDVFEAGVDLPNNSLVQVWQEHRAVKDVVNIMERIIKGGWHVLYCRQWRLNAGSTTLAQSYKVDPRGGFHKHTGSEDLLDKILGGEACMWSKNVDGSNFYNKAWPRAAAIAEVLWSARDLKNVPEVPLHRIREQMNRMYERGIPVTLKSKY